MNDLTTGPSGIERIPCEMKIKIFVHMTDMRSARSLAQTSQVFAATYHNNAVKIDQAITMNIAHRVAKERIGFQSLSIIKAGIMVYQASHLDVPFALDLFSDFFYLNSDYEVTKKDLNIIKSLDTPCGLLSTAYVLSVMALASWCGLFSNLNAGDAEGWEYHERFLKMYEPALRLKILMYAEACYQASHQQEFERILDLPIAKKAANEAEEAAKKAAEKAKQAQHGTDEAVKEAEEAAKKKKKDEEYQNTPIAAPQRGHF
ncbi:Uu.00g003870.m01.CDS01 [Anthostomella pinea]|uniref:Uu.00g003870.m01.CDS01 n=1 Tax=Anthostomella pinea TaxID=933095 RepID=A0AAI8YIS2_9PEZI|nr:Uu.00g003870.m01.CDS01 [Anthostomella pinea]